jgi:hypothetical protein
MDYVNFAKVLDSLPSTLLPGTLYFVKKINSFEFFLTTKDTVPVALPVTYSDLNFETLSKNLKSYHVDTFKNTAGFIIRKEFTTPNGQIFLHVTYDGSNRITQVKIDLDPTTPDTVVLIKNLTYISNPTGDKVETRYIPSRSS